jgi:hypothetical protein
MIQGVAYSVLSIFILNEKGLSQMPFVGKYFEKKEDEGNQGTEIQTSTSG